MANLDNTILTLVEQGRALRADGRFIEAIPLLERADALAPGTPEILLSLASCLNEARHFEAAAAIWRKAISVAPGDYRMTVGAAFTELALGHFATGLQLYETRPPLPYAASLPWPLWRGEPLVGKSILLLGEQGFGDHLQYCRFVSSLAERGATVDLGTINGTVELMQGLSGIHRVLTNLTLAQPYDFWCPLMSVPHRLNMTVETIPSQVPYLHAEPAATQAWRRRLAEMGPARLNVGIVWAGNGRPDDPAANMLDRRRSLRLEAFAAVADIPGIRWVSLQKGEPASQARQAPQMFDPMAEMATLQDTAALIEALDLVISVDTSVAHLAGALGKPVWILSRFDACWRWLTDRSDSPWYPTARLFRQSRPGDWAGLLAELRAALIAHAGASEASPAAKPAEAPVDQERLLTQTFQAATADHAAGRLDKAEASYRWILSVEPRHPSSLHHLGLIAQHFGRYDEAIDLIGQAIALNGRYPSFHNSLGLALQAAGRVQEALASFRRALAVDPGSANALNNMAGALKAGGDFEAALDCYRQALDLRPDYAEALNNWANLLQGMGRSDEAITCYRRAIAIRPDLPESHYNLGNTLQLLDRPAEALTCYRQAVALRPDYADALYGAGLALQSLGEVQASIDAYRQTLAAKPGHPEAVVALAHQRLHLCDWGNYDAEVAQVTEIVRRSPEKVSPFILLGMPSTPADHFQSARAFAQGLAKVERMTHQRPTAPRRIRIGYLSADYRNHPVTFLATELMELHDRSRFEVIGYSYGPDDGDSSRRRILSAFDRWVELRDVPAAEAAKRIREDGIDILVDLTGHTKMARTAILASHPAPIQVNYLGFAGTMGTEVIDYILVDPVIAPMEDQPFYSERLVHLPNSYLVNDSTRSIAANGPSRAECGLPEQGFVFCSFNNTWKFTPAVFEIWMRLLRALPGSVLWLREMQPAATANLRREAAARGVAPERLVFAPVEPDMARHLARQRLADLFLDTLPYNSHTTGAEALWAGVPVLTCVGPTFPGRVGASLLRAVGLPELITRSPQDYESLARALAGDRGRLAALRRRLADQRTNSALFDTRRFARDLESAYQRMWDIWCAGEAPQSFAVAGS